MLWFSLLSLIAAALSEEADAQRYEQAEPLDPSIFDFVRGNTGLRESVAAMSTWIRTQQTPPSFAEAAHWLAPITGGSPSDLNFVGLAAVVYCVARSEPYRTTWKLEPEAYDALTQTLTPWDLLEQRLPRLPFPGVLVRLPDDQFIPVSADGFSEPIGVRSILVVEEVPGRRWRYLGFNDAVDPRAAAYTRGWLDVGPATARVQLTRGSGVPGGMDYRSSNEDVVWQLLINLFLVTEYDHLEGQRIRPRFPRGSQGRLMRKRKSEDQYTILRLSSGTRRQQEVLSGESGAAPGSRAPQVRHLVSGYWRGTWVLDPPEGTPIFATKPRLGRDGRELGGYLYKVATWVPPFWKGSGAGEPPGKYLVRE